MKGALGFRNTILVFLLRRKPAAKLAPIFPAVIYLVTGSE